MPALHYNDPIDDEVIMSQSLRTYKGMRPQLGDRVMVDPTSVVVGNVVLGNDVSIWPLVVIRGDVNQIVIGNRTNVQDGSVLHLTHKSAANPEGYPLIIGDDVTLGHKTMLHGCTIGNRVLIGMGTIVLDGAVVEDDVMVGAGSLISPGKRLESGHLYMGSPAKKVRPLTDAEIDSLLSSANNYVGWKNDYLSEESQIEP